MFYKYISNSSITKKNGNKNNNNNKTSKANVTDFMIKFIEKMQVLSKLHYVYWNNDLLLVHAFLGLYLIWGVQPRGDVSLGKNIDSDLP